MSKQVFRTLFGLQVFLSLLFLSGCASGPSGIQQVRVDTAARIAAEEPGDYYIGRRYFKTSQFKFWGYIRKPGQPWKTAQLVVLNEKEKLAPDRETRTFGSDHNYEYKLWGRFSGETVYEPASNGFYQEFILQRYELISTRPPPIFKSQTTGRTPTGGGPFHIERPE